jgi:hypothetical protein
MAIMALATHSATGTNLNITVVLEAIVWSQWNLYIMDTLVQDTFVHYSEVSYIWSVGVAYR